MKCYLDKNQIERLASNKEAYRLGMSRYLSGAVGDIEFTNDQSARGGTLVSGYVFTNPGADSILNKCHLVNAIFDESGILRKYSCSCDSFGLWRGACDHVVAVFLKVFDQNREIATLSRASRVSKTLLDAFEKRAYDEINARVMEHNDPVSPVRFLPVFNLDEDHKPCLSFEIGRDKLYVVKSVETLITAFKNEETIRYGKNLEMKHDVSQLDKKSQELYNLIKNEWERAVYINPYFTSIANGRFFPLTPSGMDVFFRMYSRSAVDAGSSVSADKTVSFTDDNPEIRLSVNDANTGQRAALNWEDDNSLCFINGEEFGYVLRSGALHRMSMDRYGVLRDLCRAFDSAGTRSLSFGAAEQRKFSSFLLPALRKHGFLKPNEGEEERPSLSVKAYLDAENGYVTCDPVFVYGEIEYKADSLIEPSAQRDVMGEYAFNKTLEIMGFIKEDQDVLYYMKDDDTIFDFYHSDNGLSKLREMAEVFATDAFSLVSRKPSKIPAFGLRLTGNLLEVDIDPGDFTKDELLAVLESYRLKKKYHKLRDGRFVDFEEMPGELDAVDSLITGLGVTAKQLAGGVITAPKYRALYLNDALEENPSLNTGYIDEGIKKLAGDFKDFREVDFVVPNQLDDVLRAYQKEGFRWLMTLSRYGFGGILADDMGLGKTIQVIAALLYYKENYKKNTETGVIMPSLVVAPTSLIYNWEKEIKRFAPGLSAIILSGPAAKRKEDFVPEKADVFITTYDMLKRDAENYLGTEFQYLVADEAQNIKNPGTLNARAVKSLNAQVKLALTGTPIENALSELWSIFDFVMPGYLLNASRFTKTYETPIIKQDDKTAATLLRKQISPFILRRLKSDVLAELPEKVETTLYADMTTEQRKVYLAYLAKAKGEMEETVRSGKFNESQIAILSMLTRLRQICCHPGTFIEDYAGGSGKLDLTTETVKSSLESGHRLLIFSQFTKMLSILTEKLEGDGVKYYYLDGATPSKERLEMVDSFNAGNRDVFLISLKAGGAGLNLTGADVVIHYDPWWNPAVMNQAADRAHRFGQKRTVQVFNIVAKDSIEEKIIALQSRKKDLVDAVIQEGASFISKLSREEIVELFNTGSMKND